jgi:hypothetical protein
MVTLSFKSAKKKKKDNSYHLSFQPKTNVIYPIRMSTTYFEISTMDRWIIMENRYQFEMMVERK